MTGTAQDGRGLASVSVDLDGLGHYARIHGLAADVVPEAQAALVLERAVPRFLEILGKAGMPGHALRHRRRR